MLLGLLLATAYFVYHGISGSHGLIARERLISRSIDIEREIAVLRAVQARLRQDVAALRSEPPSRDIVEEYAMSLLGLVRSGDVIIIKSGGSDSNVGSSIDGAAGIADRSAGR